VIKLGGEKMIVERCEKYYSKKYDLNCAECILYSSNEEYGLGLDSKALKLAAGFGGGMAVEDACGAMTGALMVLGNIFVVEKAHESDRIKTLAKEFIGKFKERLSTINCKELKDLYKKDDEKRCIEIVKAASEILDEIVRREKAL
jgi:C_GCAxxG_C_C family probable redox protein